MGSDANLRREMLLGRWTPKSLDTLLRTASAIGSVSNRIEFISRQFLGLPYQPATLVGSPDTPEALVVNLEAVDCFTFLDYVEAMRRSRSFLGFVRSLKAVRYRSGIVSYERRRHFFSDWTESSRISEKTREVGEGLTRSIVKSLNLKTDGCPFLPAIPFERRTIRFVPTPLGPAALSRLRTADYVGVYSEEEGLDASHVGIVVAGPEGLLIRHASSLKGKVLDEDLEEYIGPKPGIIVLRPVEHK